ncbi:MAG TPA: hypothetical protein VK673_04110 [Chthoniobacterales bacterium]|jgi:hypothetical protein|nr:hypothetical protein [Chthoniobacterales bacterium]
MVSIFLRLIGFIGFRAMLLGMFAAALLFSIAFFFATPKFFSLSKLDLLNPAHAANALIGNGRFAGGSPRPVRTWIILRFAAFVSADTAGKVRVSYHGHQIDLRLYYMKEFNSAAAPYLSSFLKGLPLTVVTRWEAFNGAYGAFIVIPSIKRDLGALLVEDSLARIGGVQPAPPASTRERYLGHLTSYGNDRSVKY